MREEYADSMMWRVGVHEEPDIEDIVRMTEEFNDVLLNTKPGWFVCWHDCCNKLRMTNEPFDSETSAELYAVAVGRDAFVVECK